MDVVKDFAAPISGRVSARFVGLPTDDPEQLAHWIEWSNAFGDRTSGYGQASSDLLYRMQLTFLDQIAARREQQQQRETPLEPGAVPSRDLLAALLAAPECFPSDQQVASNLQMLFSAGRITCEKAIAEAVLLLLKHGLWPQMRAAILSDTSGMVCRRLADEVQRFVTPTRYIARWAAEDVRLDTFDGAPLIRRGHKVILYLEAANRDPGVFADPQCFDPQRHPNRHSSFGSGTHTCPGAGLARLELPIVFAELARQVSRLEPKPGAEIVYRSNPNLGGVGSYTILVS
jgi:cytochrome P450